MEYGIRLLQSSHHSDPSVLLPFRLSNSYLSADIIISGIYELLSRRLDDSMDNHSSLFLSLGGAGTHFSRLDIPGFPLLNDDGWVQKAYRRHYIHPIDPENPHLTLNVQNICQVTLEQGLQGEWLDANDVEMYLRHVKGVFWDAEGRQMAAPVSLSVQDNYEVGAIALGSDIIIDQATPSMPLGGPQLIQGVKKSPFRHLFPEVVCGPAFQTTFDIIKLVEGNSTLPFLVKSLTADITKRWLKIQLASAVAQDFAAPTLIQH